MLIAKIAVNGVHATSTKLGTLTTGMVGARVQFTFNSSWDGLSKTAVFRCMDITKDVLNIDSEVTIPHEVLVRSGSPLYAGAYGTNADGDLVIPTRWATVGIVYSGADPSGDPSAELTPGAVDQMMIILAETKKAAEEAHQKAADAVKPYTLRAEDAAAASGQFANASNMSAESAGKHESNARASENNAKNSAQSAEQSARNALSSEQNALNSAKNAATSEQNALNSAKNAATSEQNALNSAKNAATSEQNADQSSKAAATSEQNVAAAAAAAAKSAKNAKASEDNSKATWDFAKDEARAAEAARKAAEDAAADASVSKNATLQAAEQASIDAQSAKNSATRADQVLDAALSVQTATVGQFLIVEEVNENGKPIRWKGVDRTHWTEDRGKVEILPETTLTTDENNPGEFAITENPPVLEAGKTYIVNWNGTEHKCIGLDLSALASGGVGLGDVYTYTAGAVGTAATGEPFVILYVPGTALFAGDIYPGATSVTIAIYGNGEIVHKLDNKYLDLDWLPTKTEGDEVFLPETTITFENGVCYMQALGAFVPGDKYTIVLDGEKHSFVAIEDTETDTAFQYVGNRGLAGGEDTGEPYYFCTMQNDDGYVMSLMVADKFSGDKTVAINHFTTKYNKLPKHFLPDSVGFVTANIVISSGLNSATVDVPYAALVAAHKAGKFIRGVATVENYSDNAEFVFYLNALDAEKVCLANLGCTMNLYIYADGTVSLIAGQN